MVVIKILSIVLFFTILITVVYAFSPPDFSVHNGQVYLKWDTGYQTSYTVLRSTLKGGYYDIIAEKLEENQYCDTPPEREKTYYYVILKIREDGSEEDRSKEIGVYVP